MKSKYVDETDCVEITLTLKEKILILFGLPISGSIMIGRTEKYKMTGKLMTVVDSHNLRLL